MKHDSFPYNETEWNKIVDDAFAPDAQPHVFSERYTSRKQEFRRQMEESHMKQHKFRMKKSLTAAVAVAAAIVVIPTAVYASTQIRGYFQNGGGEYQQEMVIPKSDSVSDQIMALQVGWMPDGMAIDPSSGKYSDPNGRGITMSFYKMDNKDDALTHTVSYSVSQEKDKIIPNIRISEAYYIAAECLYKTDMATAAADLTVVRTARGHKTALSETMTEEVFWETLTYEYRKEFIGEGQLIFFYKRTNRPITFSEGNFNHNGKPALPIPDSESAI